MHIKIYQIDQDRDEKHAKFCGLKDLRQLGATVRPDTYNEVFDGEVDCKNLESVYQIFNLNHPPDFRGHSMSISDVVEIVDSPDNELRGCFFCDEIGFESIDFDTSQTQKPDNLLRVVMVEPDKPAYETEIADSLKPLQRAVGGRLEVTYPFGEDLVVVSNEESKIEGLPENREVYGDIYHGNFFIVGDNHEGEFCSLTDEQVDSMLQRFAELEFSENFGIQQF